MQRGRPRPELCRAPGSLQGRPRPNPAMARRTLSLPMPQPYGLA